MQALTFSFAECEEGSMRDYHDAKAMAQTVRDNLKSKNVILSIAESLELVAQQFGFDNWNILAAKIAKTEKIAKSGDGIEFSAAIPVIRMFDVIKAKEFYVDFLGFTIDWEGHIFEGAPLYMQLSRAGLTLHLSEHHGDAAPGGTTLVRTKGIEKFHAELLAKDYKYNHPALDIAPYGARVMYTIDPFGNRLRFEQEIPK
jgi:catechol 2,3-dioxygenase-like lactoylglutathione lyase family enzyme